MDEAPEESVAAIRRIAHALHGSGGTYGFPAISEAASIAEDAPEAELAAAVRALLEILDAEHVQPAAEQTRILLVDDDPENSLLMQAIVAPLNAVIFPVETAGDARAQLAAEDFAVVILDLMLPDADGRSVLLWMREQERLADVPVFVMSGLGSARVQAECYSIGADGFFEKPIDPDIVRAAISTRLGGRPARSPAVPRDEDIIPAAEPGKRILLVEDDELVATIVKHRLTRAGFEIIHFDDGVEARDNASADGVCLAILDIKIPGIDGFELLEHLRSRPEFARIPVVILTALGSERDVVRALRLGASDYIVKPFSPTELVARVNRLLQPT